MSAATQEEGYGAHGGVIKGALVQSCSAPG